MSLLSLQKPAVESLRRFLAEQARLDFSYAAVGATARTPPPGYVVDRTRLRLGTGLEDYLAARAALQRWQQFQLGWVDAWPANTPLEQGQVVAVLGWAVGFWWLNACRIVYTVDETEPFSRFGFAYGSLSGHVEKGEERFLIEWHPDDDSVWFDILAFSRPNHLLTWLGYPLVRRSQKRFGRDAAAAMFRAIAANRPLPEVCQSTG